MGVLVNMNLGDLRTARKTITFTGGAGLGAVGANTFFSVTGEVLIALIVPKCETSLTEGGATATISLGVTSSVTLICAAMNAVDLDGGEFWDANAGTSQGVANGVLLDAAQKDLAITDDIIVTVGAQTVNGGVLRIELFWMPLSTNGLLVPA